MILPPRHHGAGYKQAGAYPPGFDEHRERERGRRRARSGSRSSASSLSVDEMLLQATTGDEGPGGNAGLVNAPGRNGISAPAPGSGVGPGVGGGTGRSRRGGGGGEERDGRGYEDPQGTPYQYNPPTSSASFRGGKAQQAQAQALGEPGQAREFQTHIFAPPVTGAPTKKNKFVNVNVTGEPAPAGNLGTATYPPTNEAGQRICRQCGMAGRYKDGKCVEKWGPGPMGPGTVCDR
ncbi:hypothetical protein BDZ94DRAFT_401713 [Collybia nuda]|uniref:Uncharacterized protein n=1 Tax=Collybia nuda TaxID=64659 RepID=A0A9P5XSS5_9AGAR|nr:hypothetical protein BDZ94DRAFT_401713 [Collybia nuda]